MIRSGVSSINFHKLKFSSRKQKYTTILENFVHLLKSVSYIFILVENKNTIVQYTNVRSQIK